MSYIYDEDKLKFHFFYWVTCFLRVGVLITTYIQERLDYASANLDALYGGVTLRVLLGIDYVYIIVCLCFTLAQLFGLQRRTKYGWACTIGVSLVNIIYCVYYFAFYFEDLAVEDAGRCTGIFAYSAFVLIYYIRRKPLFFSEMMPQIASSSSLEKKRFSQNDTYLCPYCKTAIPKDSMICDHCGKPVEGLMNNGVRQPETLKEKTARNIDDSNETKTISDSSLNAQIGKNNIEETKYQLEQYKSLFESGLITEEEYSSLKKKLLGI